MLSHKSIEVAGLSAAAKEVGFSALVLTPFSEGGEARRSLVTVALVSTSCTSQMWMDPYSVFCEMENGFEA